ncbi:cytochrome P450 [Micromonospora auratinigra]|uniref:cytochrome P450 n=1 Tax=Micromonospora auratinigra TaxID=261654 RepID=UPI0018D30B1F|nr:cytochrome P450 [Micromonospora auratinigra]
MSRYEDVRAVFTDWETFSSANAQAPVREPGAQARRVLREGGFTAYSGLSARVPPEHTRIRKVVQRQFGRRRYRALEPQIRANVVRLLKRMLLRAERTGDLVSDLAIDVPTITILTLLGADPAMLSTFKRWSASRAAMTWGDLSAEEQVPHAHRLVEYWHECLRLVAEAGQSERDSLVGDLVRAQRGGDPISDHEIASVCYSLLFAGHETTTALISNALSVLLAHREQWDSLVADAGKIPGAIDEVLRHSPAVITWRRQARRAATIGGVEVPAGANILLVLGSANRDERRFVDPDVFDIHRGNAREHLAFGFGIHYCLGSVLAKTQAKIVVEEVTRLCPHLRLAPDVPLAYGANLSLRAPLSVPVTWAG